MSTQLDIRKKQGSMLSVPDPVTGTSVMRGTFNKPYQMNAVNAIMNNKNKGANMFGLLGGLSAGAGLLTSLFNRPKNMNMNFGFNLDTADASTYNYNPSGDFRGSAMNLQNVGQDFITGESQMQKNLINEAYKNSLGLGAQQAQNLNQLYASRGVGRGGFSNAFSQITSNNAAEQFRKANLGIGSQFAGLGLNALGQSMKGFGQIDSNILQSGQFNAQQNQQANMFNAQQSNDYNQYLKMANYNQQVQNQNAKSSYYNNLSNNLFGLAGGFIGGGV